MKSINKQLDIPITTPEDIDRQIVQQGLHTPDAGITDPTSDNPAYDAQFYAKAPVPDISLQGVKGAPLRSFKASQPNKSWYRPNTFAGTYSASLTVSDIERQASGNKPKSNMVDYVRDMRSAAGDSEEVDQMASELNDTTSGIKEPVAPTSPDAPIPDAKDEENGMNKVLILGGGILLLYVLYSVVKK